MKKQRKLLFIAIAVVLAAGLAGTGVYFVAAANSPSSAGNDPAENPEALPATEEEDEAIPVSVVEAVLGSVSTYLTATANLVPEDEVKVLAEAEGRVIRLRVEEGDAVSRGQLLAALHRDEAEIAVSKAELKATNAQLAYERAQRMAGEQLISQEEFDKTTMDHRIAQQELAEARWRLEKTEIRAPFDGRITLRSVTVGQHVRPGDELFVVTDFDPLIARIYLPEKDVLALQPGREVRITLKADESVEFLGRIRQISPVVDIATGTVKVTIEAVQTPGAVRPGGFVTVDITRESHERAVLVPREAVIRELSKAHVFVAVDDKAVQRSVTLGLEEDGRLEILSGVASGERVVVAGQGTLEDGSPIKILRPAAQQASRLHDASRRSTSG